MTESSKVKHKKQIFTSSTSMNNTSLSHSHNNQRPHNSGGGGENLQPNMMTMISTKQTLPSNSKKKVFEYRGSSDQAARQLHNQTVLVQKNSRMRIDDYSRQQVEQVQGGGSVSHIGSFGLSEIKSPGNLANDLAQFANKPTDIITKPTAYQLKRQQHRQGGRYSNKEVNAQGIVGRRVDAPHIIVPQGSVGKSDYEPREQGQTSSTLQMIVTRGPQTTSLSPKHSPWKKPSNKNATANYARGKPKNLFGQVKLSLNQKKGTTTTDKLGQKNFKSQPGKGGDVKRASKSMEQVRHVQRQAAVQSATGVHSQAKHKQITGEGQHKKASQGQQSITAGRRTVMHNHERGEMSTEILKQKRSGATTRLQRSQQDSFLDQSLMHGGGQGAAERAGNASQIQIQNQEGEQSTNQITLNILTATADQFANKNSSAGNNNYPTGAKCKSAAARHHPKDHGRQLIQAKYLNFQREVNNHHHGKKRGRSVQDNATRINNHKASAAGSRARNSNTTGGSKAGVTGSAANPFQQISSSQGRGSANGSGNGGHSRPFGASKNQTIEIELRRRSKSRQATSGVLSDTPSKGDGKPRARSGGSSNKRKQQNLGGSSSFSPRSRATQFQEARSLLFENQSSGLSVGSKKQNLNQLLSNLDGSRPRKSSPNKKPLAGSQEYIAAKHNKSLQGHQQTAAPVGVSTSALDPAYNLSMLLNSSKDQQSIVQHNKLRTSNDNLRSTIAETQVGEGAAGQAHSQQLINHQMDDSRSMAASKMANLNASLGRILNQSNINQQRGGNSQSPRGSRGRSQPGAKNSAGISASNTSRIDKIIQENLKKQSRKTLQKKIRQHEEEIVSRKKKAELELVNERVRNTNKEKVQRRKLQQMVLMQTNNTTKAGKTTLGHERDSADFIRDEMTRMLEELPENAIVKSYKGGSKKHHNQDGSGSHAQQQSSGAFAKAGGKPPLDRSMASEGTTAQAPAPKQLQARTQKIDLEFDSQQRIEGIMMKVKQSANAMKKGASSQTGMKGKNSELPPKQLVVNRLALNRKDASEPEKHRKKQRSQERDKAIVNNNDPTLKSGEIIEGLGGDTVANRTGGRFKDHRKSYGLEFIDIRKEIHAEFKQNGGKRSPRGRGKSKIRTNLRYIGGKDKGLSKRAGDSLRGSKSQRQVHSEQNTSCNGEIMDEQEDEIANYDLNVNTSKNIISFVQNQTTVLKPHQVKITSLRIKQGGPGEKKGNQSLIHNGFGIVLKKEKIRKFMLKKQKQKLEMEEKTKQEEILKTMKVHQNLHNLDRYAKKQLKVLPHGTGGPRTGKNSQSGTHSNLRHRNQQTMRKNMTLVHDQPEIDKLVGPHNLTMTPNNNSLEVSEPSFNISAKLNQRVSSKLLKKMNRVTMNQLEHLAQNDSCQIADQSIAAADLSLIHQDCANSSGQNRHRRSSQSRGTDNYVNRSINQQLAPQFENSTSAKTLRAQLRVNKQTSSQSPPLHSADASRFEQNKLKSIDKRGDQGQKPIKVKNLKVGKKSQGGGAKPTKKRGKSVNKRSTTGASSSCTVNLNQNKQFNVRVPEAASLSNKRPSQQLTCHQMPNNSSMHKSSIQTLESEHTMNHHGGSHNKLRKNAHHSHLRHRMPSSLLSVRQLDKDLAAQIIQKEVRKFLGQIGFYRARRINASPETQPQINLFIERRSKSRDSKKSKSRSGSRGRKQSPTFIVSEKASPEHTKLIETTIIAELSGLKQQDFFEEPSSGLQSEQRDDVRRSNQRRSGNRKGGRTQHSSSSERETTGKRISRRSNKQSSGTLGSRKQSYPDTSQYPSKQLNPIVHDIQVVAEEKNNMHEILSVKTPQSRNRNSPSHASLSAHRISDSEFDFRQAQSSVESGSIERMGPFGNGNHINDAASQSSNSMFDRNAFQQYSQKKLNVIMQNSEHSKLIKFREDVLKFKEQKERRHIKKLFKQNQFSPRTFSAKQKQIDRWVIVQKQEIEKTKTNFKEEWVKTVQMIEDTQKNVEQMKSKMNMVPSHNSNSAIVSISGASAAKPNTALGAANQLNNFNSQSCNSLSSHRNYQKAGSHSNGVVGGNLLALSGLGEHQRSILMEDPPKSYRSGRQEIPQMQILPLDDKNLPDTSNADEVGHGSMGLLSSRRSANGGQGDNVHMAQSLLQYMEQRLAVHNEQKQTSLSDLKNQNRDGELGDDDEIKLDQIEVKLEDNDEKLAQSQQMIAGLSGTLDKLQHSRKPSQSSVVESDLSHQPSAEFLERLERVNKQEPFISSGISDNLMVSGDFQSLDGPFLQSVMTDSVKNPESVIHVKSAATGEKESPLKAVDSANFKNQVMTIKDFEGIDSKRTSQQSETSNERDFLKMLESRKSKVIHDGSDGISPSAEHLEEPSVIGQRETHQQQISTIDGQLAAQNIKIADMLKSQSRDIEEMVKEQTSHRSDVSSTEDRLLQEPAIISSSQTLETEQTKTGSSSNLITAKVKYNRNLVKLDELRLEDPQERESIIDQLTEELMKSLVGDCVEVLPSRAGSGGSASKEKAEEGSSSSTGASGQPNHDVYYIDQLQSEKEERKEWIDIRQRHLIENDLIRIDQYVNEIVDALLQFEIDFSSDEDEGLLKTESERARKKKEMDDNYHIQFLRQLTQPIQKPSVDILQSLQTSEIGSYKHFETTQDLGKHPIIPVNLYLEIEKAREEALLARKGQNMSKQTQMVWESIHIQNKSFFDAINESLTKFRPYGLTGEPMPWSNKVRRLQTKVDIGSVDTERLFQMVKQEAFRWSQAFCGALPSPVFCFHSQRKEKEEFNDELFQENREKRLTQVLSAETVEQEHHWLNYEYEEAQVKVDLSDMILEHLVDELASFLNSKSQGGNIDSARASNVEIYNLMTDEPDFAQSQGVVGISGMQSPSSHGQTDRIQM